MMVPFLHNKIGFVHIAKLLNLRPVSARMNGGNSLCLSQKQLEDSIMKKPVYSVAALACILAVGLSLMMPETAHAGYIDSGAGSSLVQALVAAAAGCARFWRTLRRKLGFGK